MTQGYVEDQVDNRTAMADEIDLFDLWDDIVENKTWVLVGVLGCILLVSAYLMRASDFYEAQVVIKPASDIHVLELNPPQLKVPKAERVESEEGENQDIFSKTAEEAYQDAQTALLSKEYRRDFYRDHIDVIKAYSSVYNTNLLQTQNFINFDALFSFDVSNEKKDAEQFTKLQMEFPDPEKISELLNSYTVYALTRKLQEIKNTLESKVRAEIQRLQYEADKMREKYEGNRNRRLLLLNEARQVASQLGIETPQFDRNQILTQQPPRYMYGSKALQAEVKAIQNRDALASELQFGEEYFINGLPELLFRIDQLKQLTVDFSRVKLAVVDERAIPPTSPVKPKKLLILALACVAGLFGGIMLALVMAAFKRHQEARRRTALRRLEKKNG